MKIKFFYFFSLFIFILLLKLTILLEADVSVHVLQTTGLGLEGLYFTGSELLQSKYGRLPDRIKKLIARNQVAESRVLDALFWYQHFPTVGLVLQKPFHPPLYPFLPHQFSLWQLAPKKGAGIRVAIIDTGVAGYQFADSRQYLKNANLKPEVSTNHNFNMVSMHGLDPLEQFINMIKKYSDPKKFDEEYLEINLHHWIKEYLSRDNSDFFREYLVTCGKTELVSDHTLNQKGQQALTELLNGNQGIKPTNTDFKQPFNLKKLLKPKKEEIIVEFLPAPKITNQSTTFAAGHGTHTFGIISAQDIGNGILGIAPDATTFMIKGFKDDGLSDQSTLLSAVKKATIHKVDVLNLSLKIANNINMNDKNSQLLERLISMIPYAVAASGNDGDPNRQHYAGTVEAYPARFSSVLFDIGAFSFDGKRAIIPAFSQYEPNIGPRFVMPGFDILNASVIPNQKEDSVYMFRAGTSMAAPMMTGFIALMLGEFKDLFSREQLLKVCYASAIRLHNNNDWKQKVLLGVLDMRTALFTLHVLVRIKQLNLIDDFERKFDQLLLVVNKILFAEVERYGKECLNNADFKHNYLGYFEKAKKSQYRPISEKFFISSNLSDAIDHVVENVVQTVDLEGSEVALIKMP